MMGNYKDWEGTLHASREERIRMGKEAEDRFGRICEEALKAGQAPDWFKGLRQATRREDVRGADYWAITDAGEFRVDIKRSYQAAYQHRKKLRKNKKLRKQRLDIIHEICHPSMSDAEVFDTFILHLKNKRKARLKLQTTPPT